MKNTEKKTWTLMFFLASDNTLSPSTLSQIKAIKAAGSQADTNVLVYFDPNEKGAPTRVFEINKEDKAAQSSSSDGDSGAPLVSVLTRDSISADEISKRPGPLSQQFADSLKHTDKLEAYQALDQFLGFCRESYPAKNYMLFLLGHGLVVGRDAFLPDDNPDSAIGLKTLGDILLTFSDEIAKQNEVLQLIGMHSCSMSAIEVAYQLKGTAKYMLASQGISFVGSWPYRQMLMKIYSEVAQTGGANIPELVKSLHSLCIQYSVDFMYAGYSADMCLCSLDPGHVEGLTRPIEALAKALTNGLADPHCRELIVLAHWKSQSYWQETYSDLYDFCLCLRRLCDRPERQAQQGTRTRQFHEREYDVKRIAIVDACNEVMGKLKPQSGSQLDGPVVCSDFVGPDCQYSHGLSIYFPWSQPLQDENDHVITNYGGYAFSKLGSPVPVSAAAASASAAASGPWLDFLNAYFQKTQRDDRVTEEVRDGGGTSIYQTDEAFKKVLAAAQLSFKEAVSTTGTRDFTPTTVLEGKISPPDSGGGCSCASTKNYSRKFSMSRGASLVFQGGKPSSASAGGGAGPVGPSK